MGIDRDRLEDGNHSSFQDLVCPICQNLVEEPLESPCEHIFCSAEITSWLASGHSDCPECRTALSLRDLKKPSRIIRNMLGSIRLSCNFKTNGCTEIVQYSKLESHIAVCGYAPVRCPYSGCPSHANATLLRHELTAHKQTCQFRLIECPFGCGENIPFQTADSHQILCTKIKTKCTKGCGEDVRRDQLAHHWATTCLKCDITCPIRGCNAEFPREKSDAHFEESMNVHIKLLSSVVHEQEALLDALQKKIEEIQDQSERQHRLITKLSNSNIQQTIRLKAIENTITNFFWRISGFSRKIREQTTIHSPFFHAGGFKLYMELDPDGDDEENRGHLSLYLCVAKGENDARLEWPFAHSFIFTLLDRTEDSPQHISSTVRRTALVRSNLKAGSTGHGFSKFVSHAILGTRSYNINDTVWIQCSVILD